MSEPMSVAFNAACYAMANRVLPLGFDVSSEAPSTLEALNHCIETNKRMVVSNENSESTIFADAETNYAFRAWHDWTHWHLQAPFTLEGECMVACQQVRDLAKVYGERTANQFAKLVYEEVIGQALAFAIAGNFPKDQTAFAQSFLNVMGA